MYQLTFTLKQHTPLINFQWDQDGSTIRPTEFKSKLDKWIIAKKTNCFLGAQERLESAIDNAELSKWIKGVKKENPALDYSISIYALGENLASDYINERIDDNFLKDADFKPFFGNQMNERDSQEYSQDKKKIKRLSLYHHVKIEIYSVHEDLIIEIKKQLPSFILHTNFGTRSSKGFGSFYFPISDILFPNINGTIDNSFFEREMMYGFDVSVSGTTDKERNVKLFETIDMFYKTLRSGINPTDKYKMYFKSLMWAYAKSKGKQWDKKTMKEEFLTNTTNTAQFAKYPETNSPLNWDKGLKDVFEYPRSSPIEERETSAKEKRETHQLWRDVLGIASEQMWGSYKNKYDWKVGKMPLKLIINKENVDKEKEKPVYTRFASPLFFKPLRTGLNSFRVYFEVPTHIRNSFKEKPAVLTEEMEILGKWFDINGLELPFPINFNYQDFLDFVALKNPNDIVNNGKINKKRRNKDFEDFKVGKVISYEESYNGRLMEKINPHFIVLCDIFDQLAYQAQNKSTTS